MDSLERSQSETHLHKDGLMATMRMLETEPSLIGASAHIIIGAGMKLE